MKPRQGGLIERDVRNDVPRAALAGSELDGRRQEVGTGESGDDVAVELSGPGFEQADGIRTKGHGRSFEAGRPRDCCPQRLGGFGLIGHE